MKILICSDNEVVRSALRVELEAAGHHVVAAALGALVPEAADAGALLVDPGKAKQTIAVLRDRGFAGRALIASDGPKEQVAQQVKDVGADGALSLSPREDLARRFALATGGRRRVLIVDDSEIVARLLRIELEKAGFSVDYAPDVETATSLIVKRATRPDLVLLDVNMPRVSGPQFCRFIKTNERFRSIKVVFCSSEDREKMAALAKECGADGYILKREFLGKWVAENS